jgi:hypothetical protein
METHSHRGEALVKDDPGGAGRPLSFAYFDTSAVAKPYILEPGSLQVRGLLRRHDFLSSAITPLEILSALGRRKQTGELSAKNFTAAVRRVGIDRTRWELIELGAVVLNRGKRSFSKGR